MKADCLIFKQHDSQTLEQNKKNRLREMEVKCKNLLQVYVFHFTW